MRSPAFLTKITVAMTLFASALVAGKVTIRHNGSGGTWTLVPSDAVLATSAGIPGEWDNKTLTANKVATLVTTAAGTQEFYLVDENQVPCILTVTTDRNLVSTLEARPLMWPLYLAHAISRPQGDASNANLQIHASTFGVSFMVRPLGSWTSVTMPAPGPFTPESKTSPVAATLTPSTPMAPVPPAPRDESKWSWNDPNSSSTTTTCGGTSWADPNSSSSTTTCGGPSCTDPNSSSSTTTPDPTALTISSCGTAAAQGGAPDLYAFQVNGLRQMLNYCKWREKQLGVLMWHAIPNKDQGDPNCTPNWDNIKIYRNIITKHRQGIEEALRLCQENPDLDPSYEFQAGFLMNLQQLDRWLDDLRTNEKAIEPRPKTEKKGKKK